MQKKGRKLILLAIFAALLLVLGACANNNDETQSTNKETENSDQQNNQDNMDSDAGSEDNMEGMDHSNMNMSGSDEAPAGLKTAENPTYKVGSKAIIESDHMEGMQGAEATIAGAYDTTVYTISYTTKNGGERVENHKWVIHEEIQDAGDEPFEVGAKVKIDAAHMEGMDGVTAEIDSAEETTVYMVDFTTSSGEKVKNHKWVTESELSPVK